MVVEGETGLLVPPRDAAALAAALARLLSDAPLARRLGEAGRRRVAERFSLQAMCARTVDVYREVLQAAPAGDAASGLPVTQPEIGA
jgi:glycosyltransferase involved in cell wall biosynthesis